VAGNEIYGAFTVHGRQIQRKNQRSPQTVVYKSVAERELIIFEGIMTERLTAILHEFRGLGLEELSRAPLMNRIDEKFAFRLDQLPEILDRLRGHYDVLNIGGKVIFSYRSEYFDAPDFRFFSDHHRAVPNRFKVRIRTYLDTKATFLEVKEKVKGRTDKTRMSYHADPGAFDQEASAFLSDRLRQNIDLQPVMTNSYKRITLVNKLKEERLTIDFDILNCGPGASEGKQSLSMIVIAELKQPKTDRTSPFYKLMREMQIRPFRISKFCFGMMDLYGHSVIKSNFFKAKQLFIRKLSSNVPIRRSA
jgi:hypothetical protein